MKKAFTLIELIFVIVIIGLLAAVAVPKFLNLKQNAQASSVVKLTTETAQKAVETAINYRDMEDKVFGTDFNMSDLVQVDGKGWKWNGNNDVYYEDPANNNIVAEIKMNSNEVNYSIDCTQFQDQTSQEKCAKLLGDQNSTSATLPW